MNEQFQSRSAFSVIVEKILDKPSYYFAVITSILFLIALFTYSVIQLSKKKVYSVTAKAFRILLLVQAVIFLLTSLYLVVTSVQEFMKKIGLAKDDMLYHFLQPEGQEAIHTDIKNAAITSFISRLKRTPYLLWGIFSCILTTFLIYSYFSAPKKYALCRSRSFLISPVELSLITLINFIFTIKHLFDIRSDFGLAKLFRFHEMSSYFEYVLIVLTMITSHLAFKKLSAMESGDEFF